jgi:hypothetical protein
MARESWEAANGLQQGRKRPPLREQVRSPYFWVASFAAGAALAIFDTVKQGWGYGLAGALYVVGLLASARARRR